MILSNYYARQRLGFFGLNNFGSLPDDIRGHILSVRPENPGETEALLNNSDGLQRVNGLYARWATAVALSKQIDAVRDQPEASALNTAESAAAANLTTSLERARNYYPWGSVWGRTPGNQAGLDAALASLSAGLDDYLGRIERMFVRTKDAIEVRIMDQAAREHAAAEEQVKRAQEATARAENLRAQQASEAAKQAVIEAQNTALAVQAQVESQRTIARAQETRILGLPISIAAPAGLGIAGLLFFLTRKKSGGTAVNGYRRRRRRS